MKFRSATAIFSISFCCAYVLGLALNRPLFLYYPLHGNMTWGGRAMTGIGPAIAWYGLVANAVIAASILAVILRDRHLRLLGGYLWLVPGLAMLVCMYLLRNLFA